MLQDYLSLPRPKIPLSSKILDNNDKNLIYSTNEFSSHAELAKLHNRPIQLNQSIRSLPFIFSFAMKEEVEAPDGFHNPTQKRRR